MSFSYTPGDITSIFPDDQLSSDFLIALYASMPGTAEAGFERVKPSSESQADPSNQQERRLSLMELALGETKESEVSNRFSRKIPIHSFTL
jgi:hypothetical protein